MATKSRSAHQRSLYQAYKASNRQATNRKRKLTKLAKVHPNNLQIIEALKNITYRRKTPNTQVWSKTKKAFVELCSKFKHGPDFKVAIDKNMFQLKNRVHTKGMVWNSI